MNTRIDPATVRALAEARYGSAPSHNTCCGIAEMISRMQGCLDRMEPAPSWESEPADLTLILEKAEEDQS